MMKLTPKTVEEAIAESAGEDVIPLVRILKKKKNISEFQLAEGIKREINITRNLLYRLYNINLVSFERIKDKKKGWYVYYWTFNQNKVKDLVNAQRKRKLERLKERLKREENNKFYSCAEKCLRLEFEQAFDFEFKCPECGELLEQEENENKIKEIQRRIEEITKEMEQEEKIKTRIKKSIKIKEQKETTKKKTVKKKTVKKKTTPKKTVKKKTVKKESKTTTKKSTDKKTTKKKTTPKKTATKKTVKKRK